MPPRSVPKISRAMSTSTSTESPSSVTIPTTIATAPAENQASWRRRGPR